MCVSSLTWKLGLIVVNGDDEAVVRQQEANAAQQQRQVDAVTAVTWLEADSLATVTSSVRVVGARAVQTQLHVARARPALLHGRL